MKLATIGVLVAAAMIAGPSGAAQPQTSGGVIRATPTPAPAPTASPPFLPQVTERAARARDNIVALREGRRAVADLTPQELQDVLDFDRMTRGEAPGQRTYVEQCVDQELSRLGKRPSRLDLEVIKLKCR